MRVAISKELRERVKAKFRGHCGYCGCLPDKLQIDHIVPVIRGNNVGFDHNHESNLMPACFSCNNYKMTHDLEQFRREIASQVGRCRQYSVNFRLAERFGLVKETAAPVVFYFERSTHD